MPEADPERDERTRVRLTPDSPEPRLILGVLPSTRSRRGERIRREAATPALVVVGVGLVAGSLALLKNVMLPTFSRNAPASIWVQPASAADKPIAPSLARTVVAEVASRHTGRGTDPSPADDSRHRRNRGHRRAAGDDARQGPNRGSDDAVATSGEGPSSGSSAQSGSGSDDATVRSGSGSGSRTSDDAPTETVSIDGDAGSSSSGSGSSSSGSSGSSGSGSSGSDHSGSSGSSGSDDSP